MPLIISAALDAALNYVRTNATTMHYCSAEPTTFAGVSAVSLGTCTVSVAAPAAGSPSGRQVTVTPATGTGSAAGTATHYAIVSGTELLATGNLNASVALTSGVTINSGGPFTVVIQQAVTQ